MNKDLDERLLPKNQYRDALNIDIATTEGSDIGSAQNSYGNVKVSELNITGGKCIGSILNPENQKILWFISGTSVDAIAEYDQSTQEVEPVLVDNHGGEVSFLNFNEEYLITGVNVLDGMLFWTDGNSEPKKINIDRFKQGEATSNKWTTTTKFVDASNIVTTNNVLEQDITVVKRYPLSAPELELYRDIAGTGDPSSSVLHVPINTTRTSWGQIFGAGSTDSVEYYQGIFERTLYGAWSQYDVTADMYVQFHSSEDGFASDGPYWNNVQPGMGMVYINSLGKTSGEHVYSYGTDPSSTAKSLIGITSVNRTNHRVYVNKVATYILAQYASFDPTASTSAGKRIITHPADVRVRVGQTVVGTGIPSGSLVVSVTDSTHFVINNDTTGSGVVTTLLLMNSIPDNSVIGFRYSLAAFRNESFWKYIDTNGNTVLKPEGTSSNSNLFDEDGNVVLDENGKHVRLQKIVFKPRPNFIENDVVVLKTPNTLSGASGGDELKIRIRLLSEDLWNDPVHSNQYRKVFNFKILSIDPDIIAMENSDLTNWSAKRETSTSIFEDRFPRFAYRWKYMDGEYSAISAFSEVAFLPTIEGYDFDAALGANINIQNTVSKIVLKDFMLTPQDVDSLDVLIKFSDSTSIYKYKTINNTDLASLTTFEITSDQIHALLPSNQLLRPYDNVPTTAKAQEITANRLLYGNYTNQYTVDEEPRFELSAESYNMDSLTAQKSIKSLRTYQLGASLLDVYGRQTPVYSQSDTCTITLSQEESFTANQFFVTSDFETPEWATHLKYYIKEPKREYYNITMDRVYDGETEDFVWISFPSSDVNKVQEGDEIVLKKGHDTSTPILPVPSTMKYKVIAKESAAPDVIKRRKNLIGRITNQQFATAGDTSTGYPVAGGITVRLRGGDGISTDVSLKNMADATSADRYIRIGSYKKNTVSNFYEVESIVKYDADDNSSYADDTDYYEIMLKKPFGQDVNFCEGPAGDALHTEYLELHEQELKQFDEEFQGRFFIKVLKDDHIRDNVTTVQGADGTLFGITSTQPMYWIQNIYSKNDVNNEAGFRDATCDYNNDATITHDDDNGKIKEGMSVKGTGVPDFAYVASVTSDTEFELSVATTGGSKTNQTLTFSYDGNGFESNTLGIMDAMYLHNNFTTDGVHHQKTIIGPPGVTPGPSNQYGSGTGTVWVLNNVDDLSEGMTIQSSTGTPPTFFNFMGTPAGSTQATITNVNPANNQVTFDLPFLHYYPVNSIIRFQPPQRITAYNELWSKNGEGADHLHGSMKNYYTYRGHLDDRVFLNQQRVGPQKWAIDQAWSWGQGEYGPNHAHSSSTLSGTREMGYGFRVGQKHVDFRIFNLGPFEGPFVFHGQDGPSRRHITENYTLFKSLPVAGTQFRWTNDPTSTVYTIESSTMIDINNHTNNSLDSAYIKRTNQGVKFHVELNKPVVWSPCQRWYDPATETSIQNATNDLNPGKIKPYFGIKSSSASAATTSEIQILEPVTSTQTFNSDSPAVFEVQPKETSDLNLYHETPKSSLILKTGMFVETSIVNPDGTTTTGVFDANSTITTVEPGQFMEPGFYITGDSPFAQQNLDVAAGSYVTVFTKDANGNARFTQKLLIKESVPAPPLQLSGTPVRYNFYYKSPLTWFNCYSYGNGVESNRIKDSFNEPTIDNGPRVSTTFMGQYEKETKPGGIIFSGIYNGASSINNLNQFIMAEGITKDLNPSYGSIQKLFTRNTNVISFCEHKTLKILANKDAIFNADGNTNLTATSKVLGQTIPFAGEFGISKNPESFSSYGYRIYYTDKNRNAVLRLSGDGITNISDKGMSTFFKENLSNSSDIIGSYDEDKDTYNLTLNLNTASFSESVGGWTSLKSFLPENGFSVSGDYYTVKNGELYQHNANLLRNFFYGTQYTSKIKMLFNDEPSIIKNFNTLGYEGTSSRAYTVSTDDTVLTTSGWHASSIETNGQSGQVLEFKEKEGKWFNNIIGLATIDANVDTKESTMQGLGIIPAGGITVGEGTHTARYTHNVFAYAPGNPDPTVSAIGSLALMSYGNANQMYSVGTGNPGAAGTLHAPTGFKPISATKVEGEKITGIRYIRNICEDLIPGVTYTISADITVTENGLNKAVGFGGAGIPGTEGKVSATGAVSYTWTATGSKVFLVKGKNVLCVVDNISIVVTPQEQPRYPKFRINTSSNDAYNTSFKTSTTNAAGTVDNDSYNGGNDKVFMFVHPLIVNGAKWAVQASGITVTKPNNPSSLLGNVVEKDGYLNNGTWTESNAHQGFHTNVVRCEVSISGTMPAWNINSILKFVVAPTLTQS
tara:strand:+ start:217 stop:7128 length:6912 start_codon:yes stop_codon:yes gene_type:complete